MDLYWNSLEASGTKIMMSGPVVHQLRKRRNREQTQILEDGFCGFFHLSQR